MTPQTASSPRSPSPTGTARVKIFKPGRAPTIAHTFAPSRLRPSQDKLADFFDGVLLINLNRRGERASSLYEILDRVKWPFRRPTRITAVDGQTVSVPRFWGHGNGAYGCRLSHIAALREALARGWNTVLILEDDAGFDDDATTRLELMTREVPASWDILMVGGQTIEGGLREQLTPTLARVTKINRTHAIAFQGRAILRALEILTRPRSGHTDHVLMELMEDPDIETYMPDPPIAYQRAVGPSDIGNEYGDRRYQ